MADMINLNNDDLLSKKEHFFFFITNLGNIPIMTVLSAFLLIFYTDVVGLNPAAVAILFIFARILDGFNDPVMGYIVDHLPRTKWGKFRPYIVLGSLLCSLNYMLLWLGPSLAPNGKLLIAYISYILFGITFDLMDVPLNSLIPVMSETEKERNSLSLIKSLGYMTGTILFTVLTIPFILSFPSLQQGYHVWIIVVCIFVFGFSSIGTFGVKEKSEPISKEKYNVRYLGKIIGNRAIFTHFLANLLISIAIGANTATAIYFWTYVVKRPELIGISVIFSALGILIGYIIGNPFANKFGKKNTMGFGLIIASISAFLILISDPTNFLIIFSIFVFFGVGQGFASMVSYGIQADNTDYVEWKRGYRAEGAIASLNSFNAKAGLGIGAAIPGFVLAATNYTPNAEQTSQTIQGIYWAYVVFPGILVLIAAFIILIAYPLNKEKISVITKDLKKHREPALIE
jgi:GPH family glycoside/pentoside/hexuronide:cation symporter/glucuronide carrier protein